MQYLLDTCTFIWLLNGSPRLSEKAENLIRAEDDTLYLSIASIWEIVLKYGKDPSSMKIPPQELIPSLSLQYDIQVIQISSTHIYGTLMLSQHHKDPFDRVIIAQAKAHNLTILTPDPEFTKYDVNVAW